MKQCQAPNCSRSAQSHGFCFGHGYLRTDEKYLEQQRKAREKRFKPQKKIGTEKNPVKYSFGYENQSDMFLQLWHDADKPGIGVVCLFTGEKLNYLRHKDRFWNCFAHVLPKGRYPYWKLNPENIRIVHPDFHAIIDQGTLKDRSYHPEWKWDKWDALVLKMKEEYTLFKRQNLLA